MLVPPKITTSPDSSPKSPRKTLFHDTNTSPPSSLPPSSFDTPHRDIVVTPLRSALRKPGSARRPSLPPPTPRPEGGEEPTVLRFAKDLVHTREIERRTDKSHISPEAAEFDTQGLDPRLKKDLTPAETVWLEENYEHIPNRNRLLELEPKQRALLLKVLRCPKERPPLALVSLYRLTQPSFIRIEKTLSNTTSSERPLSLELVDKIQQVANGNDLLTFLRAEIEILLGWLDTVITSNGKKYDKLMKELRDIIREEADSYSMPKNEDSTKNVPNRLVAGPLKSIKILTQSVLTDQCSFEGIVALAVPVLQQMPDSIADFFYTRPMEVLIYCAPEFEIGRNLLSAKTATRNDYQAVLKRWSDCLCNESLVLSFPGFIEDLNQGVVVFREIFTPTMNAETRLNILIAWHELVKQNPSLRSLSSTMAAFYVKRYAPLGDENMREIVVDEEEKKYLHQAFNGPNKEELHADVLEGLSHITEAVAEKLERQPPVEQLTEFFKGFNKLPKSLRGYLNQRLISNHFAYFHYTDFVKCYRALDSTLREQYEGYIRLLQKDNALVDFFVSYTVGDMYTVQERNTAIAFKADRYQELYHRICVFRDPSSRQKAWQMLLPSDKESFLKFYCISATAAFNESDCIACIVLYPKLTPHVKAVAQTFSASEWTEFFNFLSILQDSEENDLGEEDFFELLTEDNCNFIKRFLSFLTDQSTLSPPQKKVLAFIYFHFSQSERERLEELSSEQLIRFLTFYENKLWTLPPEFRRLLIVFTVDMLPPCSRRNETQTIQDSEVCYQELKEFVVSFQSLDETEKKEFLSLFGKDRQFLKAVLPQYVQLKGLHQTAEKEPAFKILQNMAMASFLYPFAVVNTPDVGYGNAYPLLMALSDFFDRLDTDSINNINDIICFVKSSNALLALLNMNDAELHKRPYFAWVVQLRGDLRGKNIAIPQVVEVPADKNTIKTRLDYIKTELPVFREVLCLLKGSSASTLPQTMGFGPYVMQIGQESNWAPRLAPKGLTSFASPAAHTIPGWSAHYVDMNDHASPKLLIASQGPIKKEHVELFLQTVGDAFVIALGYFPAEGVPEGEYGFQDYRSRLQSGRVVNLRIRDNHPVSVLTEDGELNHAVFNLLVDSARRLENQERVLVHCASGVGRTGSFILLLKLFIQLNKNAELSRLLRLFCEAPQNFSMANQHAVMSIVLRELSILRKRRFSLQDPAQLLHIFYELPLVYLQIHESDSPEKIDSFRKTAHQLSKQHRLFQSAVSISYPKLTVDQYSALNPYQASAGVLESLVGSDEYRHRVLEPQQAEYEADKAACDTRLAVRRLHNVGLLSEQENQDIHASLTGKVHVLLRMVRFELQAERASSQSLTAPNTKFSEELFDQKKYPGRRLLRVSLQDPSSRLLKFLGHEHAGQLNKNFPHGVQIWVNDLDVSPLHTGMIVEHRVLIALNSLLCAAGMMVRDLEVIFPHTKSAQFLYGEILREYQACQQQLIGLQKENVLLLIRLFQKKIIELLRNIPENLVLTPSDLEKELMKQEQLVSGTIDWFLLESRLNSKTSDIVRQFYRAATDAQAMLGQDILVVNKQNNSLRWELVQRKGGKVTAHPPKGMYRGELANQARTWTGTAVMTRDGVHKIQVMDNILRVGSPTQDKGEVGVIAAADAIEAQVSDHRAVARQSADDYATVTLYNHLVTPSGFVGWYGNEIQQFNHARIGAYAANSPVLYMCTRIKEPSAPESLYRDTLFNRKHNQLIDNVNKLAMVELLRLMRAKFSLQALDSVPRYIALLDNVRRAARAYVDVLKQERNTAAAKTAAKRNFERQEAALYVELNTEDSNLQFELSLVEFDEAQKNTNIYKLYETAHRLFTSEAWKQDELNGVLPALLQVFAQELGIFHTLGCKSAHDRTAYVMAIKWMLRKQLIDGNFQFSDEALEQARREAWNEFRLTSSDQLTALDTRSGGPEIKKYLGDAQITEGTEELITGKDRSSHERYPDAIGFKATVKQWAKAIIPVPTLAVAGVLASFVIGLVSLATPAGWAAIILVGLITLGCVAVKLCKDQVSCREMALRAEAVTQKALPDAAPPADDPGSTSRIAVGAGVHLTEPPAENPALGMAVVPVPVSTPSHDLVASTVAPDGGAEDASSVSSRGCSPS